MIIGGLGLDQLFETRTEGVEGARFIFLNEAAVADNVDGQNCSEASLFSSLP